MNPSLIVVITIAVLLFVFQRRSSVGVNNSSASDLGLPKLGATIAQNARLEYSRWAGRSELSPDMRFTLIGYWKALGLSKIQAEKNVDSRVFWSAAFISFIVRASGAGSLFKYSDTHTDYVAAAKRNRVAGNKKNPFWLYRVSEIAPRVGDLICNARNSSGVTFDNVDTRGHQDSHCDVVVAVHAGFIEVIGGNVGDTVTLRKIRTGSGGFLGSEYYAVLRVHDARDSDIS